MAATLTRVVVGPSGSIWMVVVPDDDKQLNDSAYSPPGLTPIDVPRTAYAAIKTDRDELVLLQSIVASKNANIANQLGLKIQAIDAAVAAAAMAQANPVVLDPTTEAALLNQRLGFLSALALNPQLSWDIYATANPVIIPSQAVGP